MANQCGTSQTSTMNLTRDSRWHMLQNAKKTHALVLKHIRVASQTSTMNLTRGSGQHMSQKRKKRMLWICEEYKSVAIVKTISLTERGNVVNRQVQTFILDEWWPYFMHARLNLTEMCAMNQLYFKHICEPLTLCDISSSSMS